MLPSIATSRPSVCAPSAPASRLEHRHLRSRSTPGGSGRFRSRWWPRRLVRLAPARSRAAAASRQLWHCALQSTGAIAWLLGTDSQGCQALAESFLPESLPGPPLAGTLEQRIDSLITRHSERTHVSTEELRQAVMGSERQLIGGGAGSSAMTDGIRISISCDMGDAPSPQRHISRGTGSRESDGSDSDASDTGSDIWGSGRTSVLLAPPARGTGSTFPSAAEYGRSGLVQERVHRQYDC